MKAVLDPGVQHHLQAQERFEELRQATMLRAGRKLCDFAYANAQGGPPSEVKEAIRWALDTATGNDLQYTPYGGSRLTRRLVGDELAASHLPEFGWRNIVLTPGAMSALNVLLRLMHQTGEDNEVLVMTPCWMDYPLYIRNLGYSLRLVPLNEGTGRIDFERLRDALSPRTRVVVLSQPGNPTGVLHSAEDLRTLAQILRESAQPPLLLSDECHRDYVFQGHAFVSPVSEYENTCVVYSFGKRMLIQGQRIGYVAVSPRMEHAAEFADNLARLCRTMGFCTPTALMQRALRKLIALKPEVERYEALQSQAVAVLKGAGYRLIPPNATFFVYVTVPDGIDEFEFVKLAAKRGVLVMPGEMFSDRGHFRLSLTATDDRISVGLSHLADAAAELKSR